MDLHVEMRSFLSPPPSSLPVVSQCVAPGQAFTQLDRDETLTVLHNLSSVCTDVDPEVH